MIIIGQERDARAVTSPAKAHMEYTCTFELADTWHKESRTSQARLRTAKYAETKLLKHKLRTRRLRVAGTNLKMFLNLNTWARSSQQMATMRKTLRNVVRWRLQDVVTCVQYSVQKAFHFGSRLKFIRLRCAVF